MYLVIDLHKARTGVIPIDHKGIHEATDRLLRWNGRNVNKHGQVLKVDSAQTNIQFKNARGEDRKAKVYLHGGSDHELPVHGQHRLVTRQHWDGSVSHEHSVHIHARDFHDFHSELHSKIRSTLAHEITHASDPAIEKDHERRAVGSKQRGSVPKSREDVHKYVNHPKEVTARMQQMHREITDAHDDVKAYPKHWNPKHILDTHSVTWNKVKHHLTPDNRERVLKMAAYTHRAMTEGQLSFRDREFRRAINILKSHQC